MSQSQDLTAHHNLYGFLIERTAKRYKQYLQRVFQQNGFGITVDQWVILNHIDREGQIYTNTLAQGVMKDAPTVTRILDLLEDRSLVKRLVDKEDRRKTQLRLSLQGKELVQQVRPVVVEMRKLGWQGLDDKDYRDLERILNRIYLNVDELKSDAVVRSNKKMVNV